MLISNERSLVCGHAECVTGFPCKRASVKVWHVATNTGDIYGVAASNKTEAKLFVQTRLTNDQSPDTPLSAHYVGTSRHWTYGTVLAY